MIDAQTHNPASIYYTVLDPGPKLFCSASKQISYSCYLRISAVVFFPFEKTKFLIGPECKYDGNNYAEDAKRYRELIR